MIALIGFVFYILDALLSLLVFAMIASAILSWLVAFDVINLRNQFVYGIARFLEAVTRPVLAPFQKIIPPLGNVDISPIVAILVISGIQRYLLPAAQAAVYGLVA
ncbi:YggT family protein [Phenylobacterium sp.]|uniref:YggT family protein n=1 Tax=Phenylobacterium sp. TaxID=1871053 RepID=UPI00286D09D5|nr:YggT family protein [Phenylobacterium sp.]